MIKQMLQAAVVGVALFSGTVVAMDYAFSMPEVYKSYSTRECVKVETYPGLLFGQEQFSCENLPSRYDLVWVK